MINVIYKVDTLLVTTVKVFENPHTDLVWRGDFTACQLNYLSTKLITATVNILCIRVCTILQLNHCEEYVFPHYLLTYGY